MNRLKCLIAYDGTHFSGYQIQPKGRTVQGVIESALTKMHKGKEMKTEASGRTDAGVHAKEQVIHFDSGLRIPEQGWKKGLNTLLPEDIVIKTVEEVDRSFHARYDVKKKEYRYRVLLTPEPNVFRRHHTFHHPRPVDVSAVKNAAATFIGTHDFSSFCGAKTTAKKRVRTIYEMAVDEAEDELVFRFVGSGFLYQMVRILVGTLLEVGRGERLPSEIEAALEAKDRNKAGVTAPGHGLFLWKVTY
jgi:tRNA pseudouridine38-40 synthase